VSGIVASRARPARAVFRLTRPGDAEVDAFLEAQRDAPFTYPEVGATRGATSAAYARAVQALRGWRMTALGWASVHPAPAPLVPGTMVAVVVRHYGFWSMHAARIVYVCDEVVRDDGGEVHRFGFAYGTLPAHAASGEERFAVEWRRADDGVWYDLSAFSRPRHPLARLGRPLARWQQRRFGRASTRAMADAVRDATRDAAAVHDR
jgi:uncharacterized protein (UPF0548 family)